MADGKEGGEYLVNKVKVDANGVPLKTTTEATVVNTKAETLTGTDVVSEAKKKK